jgi:hypothetical protein
MKLFIAFAFLALAFAQQTDPVPADLKLRIVTAHRDQGTAREAMITAMQAYHAAEIKGQAATRLLAKGKADADALCGPGNEFSVDLVKCVARKK